LLKLGKVFVVSRQRLDFAPKIFNEGWTRGNLIPIAKAKNGINFGVDSGGER
jgi:hypothetical protein